MTYKPSKEALEAARFAEAKFDNQTPIKLPEDSPMLQRHKEDMTGVIIKEPKKKKTAP